MNLLLIAGLGNPGPKYRNTRHNVGFMITGHLAEKYGINGSFVSKFNAIVGKGNIKGHEALIVQPQTFMNLSGEAVQKVMNYYRVEVKDLFVVFDDISIDFGRIRFRPSGSAGSHNGVKSIIQHAGSEEFPRLKVGVGPNPGEHLWASYVLKPFAKEESEHLPEIINLSIKGIECFIEEGVESARNKFNGINILNGLGEPDN